MNRYIPRRRAVPLAVLILAALTSGCWWQPEEPQEVELPYAPPGMKIVTAPALEPITPTVIVNGPRAGKRIALTFDACSTMRPSRYDERIAKVLIEMNVPATIFLGGKWMEEHPEHTRYLASVPQFELGNHSYLHPHMVREPDERLQQELQWTQDVMHTLTGRQATLFRSALRRD